MEVFRAVLEARDPSINCARMYRLEAGPDLFGVWLVEIAYGKIGTQGHRKRYVVDDEQSACKLVKQKMQRRGTTTKRIGVPYQICEWWDSGRWMPLAL